ncbi:mobilization protein [Phocaeicola dorei]
MATKSSIHIKPCNIASSEAHNRRTAEYMRNIGESRIYVVPELSTDNEQWINPDFGTPELRTHYDNIKQMVKEKTGRAMQEKERERKGKNGKIIKVAGCSPIREGVLLIRPDTTLADVRKFGEECQRRWGITPLQIFLHKDEGHWLNGQPEADNIKRMVKEKTGRAMQEKERERKGKNGKIIKVAGCSPIREGVLLIRPDTTLADVRKFGEECQRRWGITPLQIFLHKDEGHWLNGQPEAEDKECFQVGNRWFKPNYHAHIVFDWMNHETGKSRKLNDEDMATMQTLASDILLMERGQAKAVTGKEHLERNDFIIEKQKAELQRIEETKRHKEQQVSLAEQELKQVKAEIRTDKLKSAATDVATAITSSVGSLFGSGKLKELEHNIEQLHQEIANRDKATDELKIQMQQMQEQHGRQIRNLQGIHNKEIEAKDKEISRLNTLLEKALCWFPLLKEMLRMEKLCYVTGFTKGMVDSLLYKKEALRCSGKIYSEEYRQRFETKNVIFKIERSPIDKNKLMLTINQQPISEWFKEQWEKLQQHLRNSVQKEQKSRGFRM